MTPTAPSPHAISAEAGAATTDIEDAARYRYLRDVASVTVYTNAFWLTYFADSRADAFNAAIDAARKA